MDYTMTIEEAIAMSDWATKQEVDQYLESIAQDEELAEAEEDYMYHKYANVVISRITKTYGNLINSYFEEGI